VFRFDAVAERLWRETDEVSLSPKSRSLLRHLIEHAGRPVSRAELLAEVWSGVHVSAAAIRYAVRQVRKALDDSATRPAFIESTPRRGWRFIGHAARTGPDAWLLEPAGAAARRAAPRAPAAPFVGRAAESSLLLESVARAHAGTRQTVLVAGEAGIGKTRLLEELLARVAGDRELVCARGQCVEHYGEGEAYRPILEALERLCEAIGGAAPAAVLRRHAPMWLAQLPSLTDPAARAALHAQLAGATQGRMLRELARALEELTRDRTILLWLDDLHWSDASTLALVDVLARRTEPARLLVVGTYRPAEPSAAHGALRAIERDLRIHECCVHVPLGFLAAGAVGDYVRQRFAGAAPRDLGRFLHRRTEGNPLFMVSVAEDLVLRGVLTQVGGRWRLTREPAALEAPPTVLQLLARDLERIEQGAREILRVASLAGMEFSAAAVAAGAELPVEEVEERCETLARAGRFLVAAGSAAWPDGTVASRYAFIHALHREVLAADLTAARRARLHAEVGRRKERGYAGEAAEHAAELALHFDEGRDPERAIRYLALAGEQAARRYAHREATEHLRRALALLPALPPGPERDGYELMLRLALCVPLAAIEGYAAAALETNLRRIEMLAAAGRESPEAFPVLLGLWSLQIVRADLTAACALGARLLRIADADGGSLALLQAHRVLGHSLFYRGDLRAAHRHLTDGLAGYDVAAHQRVDYTAGDDPVVLCHSYAAWSLWFLGRSDEAVAMVEEAIAVGERLAHPPSLAFALSYAAVLHQLRRDPARAVERVEAVARLATAEGFALWLALATIVRGWIATERDDVARGVAEMRDGLAAWQRTGADLGRPYFLCMVAEACGRAGRVAEGLELVAEAGKLIDRTGQHVFTAERLRVEGALLHAGAGRDGTRARRAAACFRRAVAIARRQGASALELRAATGLARLLCARGDRARARRELVPFADAIAAAPAERDVRDARTLLAELG